MIIFEVYRVISVKTYVNIFCYIIFEIIKQNNTFGNDNYIQTY